MLIFTPAGSTNQGIRVTGAARPFTVFAEPKDGAELALLSTPEDRPEKDRISWPGEYDRSGITVKGIGQSEGQKVSFAVTADDYSIYFPASPLAELSDQDFERIGEVAVLVIPAENAKSCQKLIDDIDPRVLVIVPAADGSLHADVLKACGAADAEQVQEYKLKGALPAEGRETVVLAK